MLLNIQDLSVSFGKMTVVHDVSLHVNKGECVALLGATGSGKSVTALSVLGLVQNAKIKGHIFLNNKDLTLLNDKEMQYVRGRRIGFIFQEPMTSLNPLHRVGKQVDEVLKTHFNQSSKRRVEELFQMVKLKNPKKKMRAFPHELSGGERQRVMIAMALAGKPDLLIADEPTTALDVTIQKQILDLLKFFQSQFGLSILFISHDLNVVRYMADKVYYMKNGCIVPCLAEVFPNSAYPKVKKNTICMLDVQKMNVFYDDFHVLHDVSFRVQRGKTLGVVGESGSGKTTLAHALLKLIPSMGKIILNGLDWSALHGSSLRRERIRMGFVFQDPFSSLNPRLSILDIVEEGLKLHGMFSKEERRRVVFETLRQVALFPEILNRYPHELSGGQRQRVALTRALVLRPQVLILDEPTSALDKKTQESLIQLLQKIQQDNDLTYLFISHDMQLIQRVSDDVIVLQEGVVIERASVRDLFQNPQQKYTQMLIQASFLKRRK